MSNIIPPLLSPRKMDWNLLHTFVVIAEAGGITAAAERLGRKQPSISNALRRLEEHIGKKLIERSPGNFRLTDVGTTLHREALEVYGMFTRLDTLLRDVTDVVRGHVRIVMASHVVSPLFDECLSQFHKMHPQATLSLEVMTSAGALIEIAARRASLSVCLIRERSEKLEYRRLYREFFGLFCGPSHPLFGRENLTQADLRGHSSVAFATDRFDDVLRPVALVRADAELDKNIVAQSSNLEEVRRLTISGLGISALPIHVVRRDVDDGLLWRLPPYDSPPAIDVHVAWNPSARLNRAETAFRDLITDKIKQYPIEKRTYI
ncbi:MAG: LysR family transcriptional regulator [Rhodospirillales bacterium]|nr:LysR family transcriptional regulator [Rhodospirillales bacterium]